MKQSFNVLNVKKDLIYREPTVNYANQEKMIYFKYYLLGNSCKRHFAYVRKKLHIPYDVETKKV